MKTRTSLWPEEVEKISVKLGEANQKFMRRHAGVSSQRQPVHTVYGGAHLFKANSAQKLGALALRALEEYAPDAVALTQALGLEVERPLAQIVFDRIVDKLQREPVEDFRLDFEDGYGHRPDIEENQHALSSAMEVGRGYKAKTLPPFIGIRIKPLNEDQRVRSVRTLDIFITALLSEAGGRLPDHFVITIPKIQLPEQMSAAVRFVEMLEERTGLPDGALKIEAMIETPQAIMNQRGEIAIHSLIAAAEGRCRSIHFGLYDYTAACGIAATYQTMRHPACDFARQVMLVSTAGTGVQLSDGATNFLPTAPHRAGEGILLNEEQRRENRESVHAAWRFAFEDNLHSLRTGFYQGWDLHPAQLVSRYAALYYFFLGSLTSASNRLKGLIEKAELTSLHGGLFDDAASGEGLLNFFQRGIACGAITESEAGVTGLTSKELRAHSFRKIIEQRRSR